MSDQNTIELRMVVANAFKTAVQTLAAIAANIDGNPRQARLAATALVKMRIPSALLVATTAMPADTGIVTDARSNDPKTNVPCVSELPCQPGFSPTQPTRPTKLAVSTTRAGAPLGAPISTGPPARTAA